MSANIDYKGALQVIKGFGAKADGKDKLTALIQYACLFLSAGEPGNLKKIQTSVTAARKVFRVMRPLEALAPLLADPGFKGAQPWQLEAVAKLKDVLMAIYFAADHVVWAYQIGLITNKATGERAQKMSLWGWALGSVCVAIMESANIIRKTRGQLPGETVEQFVARREKERKAINQHIFLLIHALVQAGTATGLLQLVPMRPRTVGLLGTIASAMNCYTLLPSFPQSTAKKVQAAPTLPQDVPAGKLAAKVA